MITGQRIVVPTFEIASMPTLSLMDIKQRRFNVIDRAESVINYFNEEFIIDLFALWLSGAGKMKGKEMFVDIKGYTYTIEFLKKSPFNYKIRKYIDNNILETIHKNNILIRAIGWTDGHKNWQKWYKEGKEIKRKEYWKKEI